jgi:hypothetical protein
MASLTEISINSRRVIRYGVYLIILIVIARYTFLATVFLYKKFFPPPPPKPTIAFGKMPKLPFPEKEKPADIKYVLETPDAKVPSFADQLEVYWMPPKAPDLKALEQAQKIALKLGFEGAGKPIVETIKNVYIFPKTGVPSFLTINIISDVFSVSYDLNSDPSAIQSFPPSPEEAENMAKSFFRGVNPEDEEVSARSAETQFLRIDNGKFVPVSSQSDAQFIKVNLFRKKLGKNADIASVTPKNPEANLWTIYGGSKKEPLIAAEYHYFAIDESKFSTYPLITGEEAWNRLNAGKGFIVNLNPGVTKVTVRKIFMAYYDAGQYAEYYQPVIVFQGDDNFVAYVPAITDEYYSNE